ncbi:MAG: hypothetical protein QY309_09180 [Cyclobacteriaceae bacterium]|nr:MAG: hypothetical protein QY309_09180 [Cyclobacteriaceae bacterium]
MVNVNASATEYSVIIRHSGEQTFKALHKQILRYIPEARVATVSSNSFESTLRQSYEQALQLGYPWSLLIDADILLIDRFFSFYAPRAIEANTNALGFAFRVWDRFYQSPKFRGIHFYNTQYIEQALKHIPVEGQTLRPESYVKERLAGEGLSWIKYGNIVGVHDFFQNPRDVFAKMAIRAHRSSGDFEELLSRLSRSSANQIDFIVACEGLRHGMTMDRADVKNSRIHYDEAFRRWVLASHASISDEINVPESVNFLLQTLIFRSSIKLAIKNYNSLIKWG